MHRSHGNLFSSHVITFASSQPSSFWNGEKYWIKCTRMVNFTQQLESVLPPSFFFAFLFCVLNSNRTNFDRTIFIFSYQPIKTFIDQNKTFENSKQKIRLVLHFEAGRFQESGQFGIYRPGSHENFVPSWNQPCDSIANKTNEYMQNSVVPVCVVSEWPMTSKRQCKDFSQRCEWFPEIRRHILVIILIK